MTCFDCLRCKECAKQEKTMLIVDSIGEYVYQLKIEKYCPNFLDGDAAPDLINRLQTDNSNLTSDLISLQRDLTSAKAEIEMYKDLYEELKSEHLETIRRIKSVKSEARKEFAERVHGIISPEYDEYHKAIDNLLKELDGKEKENA